MHCRVSAHCMITYTALHIHVYDYYYLRCHCQCRAEQRHNAVLGLEACLQHWELNPPKNIFTVEIRYGFDKQHMQLASIRSSCMCYCNTHINTHGNDLMKQERNTQNYQGLGDIALGTSLNISQKCVNTMGCCAWGIVWRVDWTWCGGAQIFIMYDPSYWLLSQIFKGFFDLRSPLLCCRLVVCDCRLPRFWFESDFCQTLSLCLDISKNKQMFESQERCKCACALSYIVPACDAFSVTQEAWLHSSIIFPLQLRQSSS